MGRCGVDASGSGWEPVAGSCEHDKASGSIKGGKYIYNLV